MTEDVLWNHSQMQAILQGLGSMLLSIDAERWRETYSRGQAG